MSGTPIPYSIGQDNLILSLFIASLLGGAYVLLRDGASIVERLKKMFYYKGQAVPYNSRAGISTAGNNILYLLLILYSTIIIFGYLQQSGKLQSIESSYIPFAVFAAISTLFVAAKGVIYEFINDVLFSREQAREWRESYFFTLQLLSFALLPLVATVILVPSLNNIIFNAYIIIIGIIYLIMLFIRCFNIIFNEKSYFLDIFLYLCAIELLPLCLMWQVIHQTYLFLIIKF